MTEKEVIEYAEERLSKLHPDEQDEDHIGIVVSCGWIKDVVEAINGLQERISIMQEGWNLTSEKLPVIPEDATYGIMVLCADDKSQFKKDKGWKNKSYPRDYVRREIRGKTVERWEYVTGQICYDPPKYWMYLPDPPEV